MGPTKFSCRWYPLFGVMYQVMSVTAIPNLDYKKLARDAPFSKRYLDELITKQLLGGVDILPYSGGGGETINDAKDLNCDFSGSCCWSNAAAPTDQLDWGIANSDPDPQKAEKLLKGDGPRAPYLITASTTTSSLIYADLFSCSIQCQTGPGTLTFKRWTSPGVKFDVCTVQVGQSQFTNCQSVQPGSSPDASVQIPESTRPFQIAIVASEFTKAPGGVAMIKDITYDGPVCGSSGGGGGGGTPSPSNATDTTGAPTGGGGCALCNFENGDLCQFTNGGGGDASSSEWKVRTGKTANWAAGVPVAPGNGQKYAGADLNPKQKAVLQTAPLNIPEDAVFKFRYFESAYGVTLKGCLDSPVNCPFNTPLDVSPGDRQWKDGTVPVTKGQHIIYLIGHNKNGEHAGVGVDELTFTKANGEPLTC